MKKNSKIILIALSSLVGLACFCTNVGVLPGAPTFAITPAPPEHLTALASTSESNSPTTGTAILQDDFSTDTGNLENYKDENGVIGVTDGVYSIQNFADKWMWGRITLPSTGAVSDSILAVDTKQISGPADNNTGYGVICRLNHDDTSGLDGYVFAVSADGFASIQVVNDNQFTALVDWTASDSVNTGSTDNHLVASCIGNKLTFEVNGTVVAEATDSTHTTGDAGFAAVSFNDVSRNLQVDFDNLLISKP